MTRVWSHFTRGKYLLSRVKQETAIRGKQCHVCTVDGLVEAESSKDVRPFCWFFSSCFYGIIIILIFNI